MESARSSLGKNGSVSAAARQKGAPRRSRSRAAKLTKASDWRDFEKLVARIQEQLAPSSNVRHNEKMRGASGRLRQLDVTIRQSIGLCRVLIVIECRKHKRPVGIEKVEAFVSKLRDIGSNQGVMISSSGFDAGARAIAKQNVIRLLTYREAQAIDWQELLSEKNWMRMIFSRSEQISVKAVLEDRVEVDLDGARKFFDSAGAEVMTVAGFLEDFEKTSRPAMRIGSFCWHVKFDSYLSLEMSNELKRIVTLVVSGVRRSFEYAINVNLADGHVLDDALQEKEIYKELVSEGFNWRTLVESQVGLELTPEDEKTRLRDPQFKTISLDLDNLKPYLRFVITKMVKSDS